MSAIWRPDRDDDRLLLADSGRRTDHDRLVVLINSVSVRSEKLRSYGLVYEVMGERRQKYQAESLRVDFRLKLSRVFHRKVSHPYGVAG